MWYRYSKSIHWMSRCTRYRESHRHWFLDRLYEGLAPAGDTRPESGFVMGQLTTLFGANRSGICGIITISKIICTWFISIEPFALFLAAMMS